jgi:hypothetical protein
MEEEILNAERLYQGQNRGFPAGSKACCGILMGSGESPMG